MNMYVVLIGDSGIPRKSTSIAMATGLVHRVLDADVGLVQAKATPERLNEILHERSLEYGSAQICIAIPELAVFLGTEGYAHPMPVLLTDLYDCPDYRSGGGTIARGSQPQRNVWVCFLSGSTPIWLLKTVNPDVSEGGFTSRCLFILANKPKQSIPWPDGRGAEDDYAYLVADLLTIHRHAQNSDSILLTEGAMATFGAWYRDRTHAIDPHTQSFEAREDAHVLRVAALLCINDDSWRIDYGHIVRALQLVAGVKADGKRIFEGGEIRSKYASAFDTLRIELMSAGMDPIMKGALSRKCRRGLARHEFDDLLDVLHEMGAVQRFVDPMHERGRPAMYFRGTEMLLERGLGERVLTKLT
jgi:hypothetical protein